MLTIDRGKISFEEYLTYDNGTADRYELVEGFLELMPPSIGLHNKISCFLFLLFYQEIAKSFSPWVAYPGMVGVRTGTKSVRIPDVLIITVDQDQNIRFKSAIVETPPILVVEIVSPDDPQRDDQTKKIEYEKMGIPEYWIVDPVAAQLLIFSLREGRYTQQVYQEETIIASPTLPTLTITARQILQAE